MFKDKQRLFFHPPFELIPEFFTPGRQIQTTGKADIKNMETGWSKNRRLIYWRTQTTIEKLGLFSETKLRALAITDGCEGKAGKDQ